MFANWPWTVFLILPVNKKLKGTPLEQAAMETRGMIGKCNALRAVRMALGFLVVAAFFIAVIGR